MNVAIADINTRISRIKNGIVVKAFGEAKSVRVEEFSAVGMSLGMKQRTAYGVVIKGGEESYIFNPDYIVKNVKEHQAY
jgi:hypothetical protein